jgi:hypothetical protein
MRLQTASGQVVKLANLLQIQPPSVALVGQGGIGEAITDHHLSHRESRRDDLVHVFSPIRSVQEQLGQRRQGIPVQQQLPQRFAQRRPSRLAGRHAGVAFSLQPLGQEGLLGGFAHPLPAF